MKSQIEEWLSKGIHTEETMAFRGTSSKWFADIVTQGGFTGDRMGTLGGVAIALHLPNMFETDPLKMYCNNTLINENKPSPELAVTAMEFASYWADKHSFGSYLESKGLFESAIYRFFAKRAKETDFGPDEVINHKEDYEWLARAVSYNMIPVNERENGEPDVNMTGDEARNILQGYEDKKGVIISFNKTLLEFPIAQCSFADICGPYCAGVLVDDTNLPLSTIEGIYVPTDKDSSELLELV